MDKNHTDERENSYDVTIRRRRRRGFTEMSSQGLHSPELLLRYIILLKSNIVYIKKRGHTVVVDDVDIVY
jgi:hypothetical protein